jgi:cobaltochelatase CobT
MARNLWSWDFDKEEGDIDVRKLTSIITSPSNNNFFKQKKESNIYDTIVTLLIDNSGSMRGKPITVAAIVTDILSKVLERCNIKNEVLGFTTTEWKGGKSWVEWNKTSRKASPGRLNDLLHIIYKPADQSWNRAKNNFGVMLKDGLLKENIDGEALLWAASRLKARKEKRKILIVISDGAPIDDSTLSTNGTNYLDHHLRMVIGDIENNQSIELLAIGIGYDVTKYYASSVTINDVEELSEVLFNKLADIL